MFMRPSAATSATVAMTTAGGSRLVSNFRTTISRKLNNDSLCQKVLITGLLGIYGVLFLLRHGVFTNALPTAVPPTCL